MPEEKTKSRAMRIEIDFLPGTDINDAMAEMWKLHYETRADVSTAFNDTRIIIKDERMFQKFGCSSMRSKTP